MAEEACISHLLIQQQKKTVGNLEPRCSLRTLKLLTKLGVSRGFIMKKTFAHCVYAILIGITLGVRYKFCKDLTDMFGYGHTIIEQVLN